ncbi:SUKH-4 family immunity protein [Streptomyces sp. NPDC005752]|uniref:SUKH-4 family immunity protein n=1 Tax=Streptomyces sp. NPDC005752 TaxID=3157065 RepID=UPI0033F44C88
MLFDITRGRLAGLFGEGRLVTLPATAFPPAAADTEGARLLQAVGVPTGTLWLREHDTGGLPLVRDVAHVEDFENVPEGAREWPVVGWLLNAHLALDPGSGTVHAFDPDEETVRQLHADVSSLVQVGLRFQRLLEEFTFEDDSDEEAGFERLDREVDRVRRETSAVDPLPFQDDETVWSVIGDEIAAGQHFRGDSPGARSLPG